ncbi:MAG: divergent polysaccharide deacetylase family protein [Pseudomonadota bacterium]
MAADRKSASKPGHLLPLAWGAFGALLAGLLIWLSGAADQTVEDLKARADKSSLMASLELEAPPVPTDDEPAASTDEDGAADAPSESDPAADETADGEEEPAPTEDAPTQTADAEENAAEENAAEENDGEEDAAVTDPDAASTDETAALDQPADTGDADGSETDTGAGALALAEPEAPDVPDDLAEVTADEAEEALAEDQTAALAPEAVEEDVAVEDDVAADAVDEIEDGRPPWLANSRPFDNPDNRPKIAIVVTDLGLSAAATQLAIQDLPGEVTLAFAAHAQDLANWIPQSRAAGHEALVMVPMEPEDYPVNDPGPYTLLTSQAAGTNVDRLDWSLRRAGGFVGIVDTKGSRFTSVADAVTPIVEELGNRGLMVLDSGSNEESVMPAVARQQNVPVSANDSFITDFASGDAIDLRLEELEAIARDRGSAVGLAFPYPIMFDRLKTWIASLEQKNLVLAPITAVVDQPG